jgi:hypothetical protein
MTTRTIAGVTFVKAGPIETKEAGALSLWLTTDNRFELRGDDLLDMTAGERGGMEWGVWDRQAGREGDWADGGRGNGVDSMADGAALIAEVIAAEIAERRAQAAATPERFAVGAQVTLRSINSLEAPRVVTVIGYTAEGNALYAEGRVEVRITDARNLVV